MTLDLEPQFSQSWATEVVILLAELRTMYEPRPTPWSGLDREQMQATTQAWLSVLAVAQVSPSDVRLAIERWRAGDHGSFFPSPVDLIRFITERTREAQRHVPPPRAPGGCTGSGWLSIDGDRTPCPRCSPAMYDVWNDPDKYARWKAGTPLHHLDVGVTKVGGALVLDAGQPPRCGEYRPEHDVIDPAKGKRTAWEAYVAESADAGREPNRNWFESILGAEVTNPARPAPPRGETPEVTNPIAGLPDDEDF